MADEFSNGKNASKLKMAVIAGASEALKMKQKEWRTDDRDIIQEITRKMEEIVRNID